MAKGQAAAETVVVFVPSWGRHVRLPVSHQMPTKDRSDHIERMIRAGSDAGAVALLFGISRQRVYQIAAKRLGPGRRGHRRFG